MDFSDKTNSNGIYLDESQMTNTIDFQRDTVTNTDVSSTREGGMDFYVPTSRLGFVFSEIARSRDVIGIIMFSPTSI